MNNECPECGRDLIKSSTITSSGCTESWYCPCQADELNITDLKDKHNEPESIVGDLIQIVDDLLFGKQPEEVLNTTIKNITQEELNALIGNRAVIDKTADKTIDMMDKAGKQPETINQIEGGVMNDIEDIRKAKSPYKIYVDTERGNVGVYSTKKYKNDIEYIRKDKVMFCDTCDNKRSTMQDIIFCHVHGDLPSDRTCDKWELRK